jgi:hypothetical protein
MNRPANSAVFAVVTLTEKAILPAGPRTVLTCVGWVILDTQICPPAVLCGRRTSSVNVWPPTRLRGSSGLELLAALQCSEATSLLFP